MKITSSVKSKHLHYCPCTFFKFTLKIGLFCNLYWQCYLNVKFSHSDMNFLNLTER